MVHATFRLHFGDVENLKDKDTIASLTGSMLMRGTTKHTRQQITDAFDKLKAQVRIFGSATGAIANIQTTRESFPAVMQLVAEVLRAPCFPEAEFEALKQQQITMYEGQRREPQAIAFQNAERHLYPYPKGDVRYVHTIDEWIENVKAAKLEDVKNFYQEFYGASNAEFAAMGDFDPEPLEKQIATLYGGWTSKQHYARVIRNYREVPVINNSFDTPDKANSMFVAFEPVKMHDENPEYPALVLANYMVGGGFLNSRLAARIRVKEGLSYGIGSMLEVAVPNEDEATFMAYAIAAPQNVAKVEADFVEEMKRALDAGFSDEEIAAAKSGWLQSRQVSRGQDNELASKLATNTRWGRTMQWDANIEQKVKALTAVDVNAAFRKYIDLSKISIIKAGDFAKVKAAATTGTPGSVVAQ
ncbi:MAG: insulinase family protein [Acidobacteriaceae bacterium]|nr:insulinase family protein [Acidobacteriaceae bacterium]